MSDILLIQPPVEDFYLTKKRTIPYGLACIASALRQKGFSVEILDGLATSKSRSLPLPSEMEHLRDFYTGSDLSPFALFQDFKHFGYSFEHLGAKAKESGAFLVGIASLFTAYSREALKTAEAVKRLHPQCRIVLGGHHPTALPEAVMACEAVDFVIMGEGEVSMPLLAEALQGKGLLESVPGLVFRDGKAVVGPCKPAFMNDLDIQPPPALELIDGKFYARTEGRSAVLVASRGCPMQCSYCVFGASSPVPYRRRSVASVLREMETAVLEHGAAFIDLEDENLSLDRKWFMEFLDQVRERLAGRSPELRAMNGLYPPSLDDAVVRAMKRAGFKTLNLSLGTTCRSQLRRFGRSCAREAFEAALLSAERWGLEAVGYVIVGAPGQRAPDSVSDLLYLASQRVLVGVSVFYPAPGSLDFKRCKELGVLPESFSLMRSSALPVAHTTTREESATLLRLARLLNFMKSCIDAGMEAPGPAHAEAVRLHGAEDRRELGRSLLQGFLQDGRILGARRSGEIFEHKFSLRLAQQFLEGLKTIPVRGVAAASERAWRL